MSDSMIWPTVAASTLADQVYQIVRDRILQTELPPGTFIREQEVSAATGVSRTPVREALSRLSSEGFLERIPRRGFKVPDEPWEALLEVYPIVSVLEKLAGSLGIERINESDIRELRTINQELKSAAAARNVREMVEANNQFHHVISRRSGNHRLTDLLAQLRDQVTLLDFWHYSKPEHALESYEEHDQIIDALANGRQADALKILESNYARAHDALVRERAQLPEKADIPFFRVES